MANPRIEVEIGAKVDGLSTGVDQATKQLNKLESAVSQTAPELNKLTRATQQYNSIGTDFARIVQDAPFGIIGVGNNITQLAGSFQTLKNQTGSTSQALKTAFASIFSSGNALILGISALTTVFTVLQMKGFFKTGEEAESAADKLDKFKSSLDSSTQAVLEAANNADREIVKIQSLKRIIEDETLSRGKRLAAIKQVRDEAPEIFKNLTEEQILAGKVGDSYARLTQILLARATAQSSIQKIVQLNDEERTLLEKNAGVLQQIAEFERRAAEFRKQGQQELVLINENQIRFLRNQNPELQRINDIETERQKLTGLINENLAQSVDFVDKAGKATDDSKKKVEFYDKVWAENEARLIRISQLGREIADGLPDAVRLPKTAPVKETADTVPLGRIEEIQQQIKLFTDLRNAQTDTSAIKKYNEQIFLLQEKLKEFTTVGQEVSEANELLLSSFSALGNQIAASLNIGNDALRGFISTVLSSTPKIIQAIFKQVAAKKAAAAAEIATNSQVAASEGIAVASKAANALGPVGLALLPVFIGGALALISSAFSKSGGGGKVGSVGASGLGAGTSFSGGATGFGFAQNREIRGELVARGQDLVYVFNEANTRINKG